MFFTAAIDCGFKPPSSMEPPPAKAGRRAVGRPVNRCRAGPVPSQVLVGIEVLGQSIERRRRAVGVFLKGMLDRLGRPFLKIALA